MQREDNGKRRIKGKLSLPVRTGPKERKIAEGTELSPDPLKPLSAGGFEAASAATVILTQGSLPFSSTSERPVQPASVMNADIVSGIRGSLSTPRLKQYIKESYKYPQSHLLDIYVWNSELCKEVMFSMNIWEVCLRNKLSSVLSGAYGGDWPYSSALLRKLSGDDCKKLANAKERQEKKHKVRAAPRDAVVADLTVGFWSSLLTKGYEVSFGWRFGGKLDAIFPHNASMTFSQISESQERLRVLRNRVAHHEPIFHMDLSARRDDLQALLSAMCTDSAKFANIYCSFRDVIQRGPRRDIKDAVDAGRGPPSDEEARGNCSFVVERRR